MSTTEEDINPYQLLDVAIEATDEGIRKAYRKGSLKVHPDRNPNNPDAARKFHELNQAYELLLDPLRRLVLDTKLRQQRARKEKFKSYDNKRKKLVEELDERERAAKKAKTKTAAENAKARHEEEKIKDQGKRMREERQKQFEREQLERGKSEREDDEPPPPPASGPNDTSIKVKYTLASQPTLTTKESICNLLNVFGEIDTDGVVLLLKPHNKPKRGLAFVPFKKIGDAFTAVCAGEGMEGIEVEWADGKEPEILGWLRSMGKLGTPTPTANTEPVRDAPKATLPQLQESSGPPSAYGSFPESFPDTTSTEPALTDAGLDYQSLTLMRMRQAERERLEREILEQEAEEDA